MNQFKKKHNIYKIFKMHTERIFYTFSNNKEIMINLIAVPLASRGSIIRLNGC